MSFSSNRKAVLDASLPLEHRASHARSCALHVANKLGVPRSVVLVEVANRTGVDLGGAVGVSELLKALALLEELRLGQATIDGAKAV
jgi:hypothetical protein